MARNVLLSTHSRFKICSSSNCLVLSRPFIFMPQFPRIHFLPFLTHSNCHNPPHPHLSDTPHPHTPSKHTQPNFTPTSICETSIELRSLRSCHRLKNQVCISKCSKPPPFLADFAFSKVEHFSQTTVIKHLFRKIHLSKTEFTPTLHIAFFSNNSYKTFILRGQDRIYFDFAWH